MSSISKGRVSRSVAAVWAGALALVFAVLLWTAPRAGADLLYWDNYSENTVAFASIDGSGGGPLNFSGATLKGPEGMTYDPVTNRMFIAAANSGAGEEGEILFVNLDGSGAGVLSTPGAPVDDPEGIALDPATRIVYWINTGSTDSVAWAKVDGTGGGTLSTAGATFENPYRMGFDPVAGRVFWPNNPALPGPETISYANVDNSGGGNLDLSGATPPEGITGFSVDPAGGRIYWLDNTSGKVSYASLSGGGGGDVDLTGAVFKDPYGLAFDPSIGRLYWGNYESGSTEKTGTIGFVDLAGGGGGIDIASAPVAGPQDPVIIKNPSGTEAPVVTRSANSRSVLNCSSGGWGPDYPGSFVYQSPRDFAYQWSRNGTAVGGATQTTYSAKSAGKYICSVTASNQSGSTAQASAAVKVNAAKIKLSTKKKAKVKAGKLAKFKLTGVNQGDLRSKKARVCVKLSKKVRKALKAPKCKVLGKLKGRAKKKVVLKLKARSSAKKGAYKVYFVVKGSAGKSAKARVIVK